MKLLSPHIVLCLGLLATSNAHLIAFPATTAAIHYLYRYNHLRKLTLYFDMQKLGRNENYVATFESIKQVLMTDSRLALYVEQNLDGKISEDERTRTLIFENPAFMPFAYKMQGMVGKIDERRTRYSFECIFRDLLKGSLGRIKALIIFNERNEAYFEALTLDMEKPRIETIRIVEEDIEVTEHTEDEWKLSHLNAPRGSSANKAQPQERP